MVGTQSQTARSAIAAEVATQVAAHLATAAQQQPTITHQNQYVPTNPDVDFEKVAKQFINKRLPLCVELGRSGYTSIRRRKVGGVC